MTTTTYLLPQKFYEDIHSDYHVNFQLNRFLAYVGESELEKIRRVAGRYRLT